jgi:hypothetical protein
MRAGLFRTPELQELVTSMKSSGFQLHEKGFDNHIGSLISGISTELFTSIGALK